MSQGKPIAMAMAATITECQQEQLLYVYTSIGEVLSCLSICHIASNQSSTWKWPGNEANEVMQQLISVSSWCTVRNKRPETQSVGPNCMSIKSLFNWFSQ